MCIPARDGFLPSNRDLALSCLCCIALLSVLDRVDTSHQSFSRTCARLESLPPLQRVSSLDWPGWAPFLSSSQRSYVLHSFHGARMEIDARRLGIGSLGGEVELRLS
jgi:hypothetical protein